MYRQGDLLLVAIPSGRLDDARRVPSGIVQLGAATGHEHRLVGGEVYDIYETKYLVSDGSAELVHEEHPSITLPAGEYRVVRQRQEEGEGRWSDVID